MGPLETVITVIQKEKFHDSFQTLSGWKEPCSMLERMRSGLAMSLCPKEVSPF